MIETTNDAAAAPRISVCITTRARPVQLERCLRDLVTQRDAPSFEVLVCCQGDVLAEQVVRRHFPKATVGAVDDAHPGGARNFLVRRARGDLLVFLDDDVTFPPSLLARFDELATTHPAVAVFGGPNLTPPESSFFQVVQGAVLGSILATGPIRRRYAKHPSGPADERFFTLCNMAVRRAAMLPFPPSLSGGEESAVLDELATELAKMHYDPELYVYHERRGSYRSFTQQMVKYGRGRGQVIVTRPRSCRPVHLIALLQPAWVLSLPVLAVLWTPWYLVSAAAYGAGLAAAGAAVALRARHMPATHRLAAGVLAMALTATVHASYGIGVLRGLLWRRGAPVSEWRPLAEPVPARLAADELS